jgi:hypothetical protein
MEAFMVQKIVTDEELLALFDPRLAADFFYASSSLGQGPVPADPPKPFMTWTELPSQPFREVRETSNAQIRSFQFFVYDEAGDFTVINQTLEVVRRIVKQMAPFTTPEGHRCSDSEWFGISGNLPADAYDGVCRFGTARFVVSQ